MSALSSAYSALSDLSLWMKISAGDVLKLSDIPALIKLRIKYIVDNWASIEKKIVESQSEYDNPERLQYELQKFNDQVKTFIVRPDSLDTISEIKLLSDYFTVFDSINISDINVSPQEAKILEAEISRVNAFTLNKFKSIRSDLIKGRDAVADNIGGNDTTYDEVYRRSPLPKLLNKSIKQIEVTGQMQVGIDAATDIIANALTAIQSTAIVDPFAFARANANNPNIDIESFKSGRLTRINYGESLQALALRTMGDSSRWIEIAIANGLKPPYIDEVGEGVPLIANGKGNTINIAKSDVGGNLNINKLYINQIVIIQSDSERTPDQRVIVSVKEIPISGEIVIELSGDADLDKYKTADSASLRIYKPNTINSNFFILIPNNDESQPVIKETPWFLNSKGQDERNAGVDLLLSDDNDLSFIPAGDLQLSYGVQNGLQALKILLSTERGTVVRYPDYGIVNLIGQPNTDPVAIRSAIAESVSQQILNDSRFDRLDFLTVESLSDPLNTVNGNSGYRVSVGVVLSGGGSNVIPITFQINTSKA